jgi:hypothetical protein
MRFASSLAILAALAIPAALLPTAAHADSITFGSGISDVTYVSTTPASTGSAVLYTSTNPYGVGSYATPVSGTSYITWNDSLDETLVPAGTVDYFVTFTSTGNGTGSVQFAADNSVVAFLNSSQIGSSNTFSTLTSANFSFSTGLNTLEFAVTNTVADPTGSANPTALDFGGSVEFTQASPVPEPSSMALLGTGILGLAGVARRKFLR